MSPANHSRKCTGAALWVTLLLAAAPLWGGVDFQADTNRTPDITQELRVLDVRPRVFDYLFNGACTGPHSNSAPQLNFRDLNGQDATVRLSDHMGEYTVTAFTPRSVRVFRETIHSTIDEDASTVTLRDAAGSNHVLTAGKPLTESGMMACLVSLRSGNWSYVHDGDTLSWYGTNLFVLDVAQTTTTVRLPAREPVVIARISDAERKSVLSIWETHRLEGEAQQARERAQELERRKVAAEAEIRTAADHAVTPVPAKPSAASTTPVFTFGYVGGVPDDYSYRYPRRMVVVPYTYYWPNGQTTTTEILVPAWYEPHHEERSHRRHELTPTP